MIIIKENNTLSKQIEEVEKQVKENSKIISEISNRAEQEIIQLNKLKVKDLEYKSQLNNELEKELMEIHKKEINELKPYETQLIEEIKERKSIAIKLSLGVSSLGVLFLFKSFIFFFIPIVLFIGSYLLINKIYSSPILDKTKEIKNNNKFLKKKMITKTNELIKNQQLKTLNTIERISNDLLSESHIKKGKIIAKNRILNEEYVILKKGNDGEKIVSNLLISSLNNDFLLLNDITIPSLNGRTTQIDHIVITQYGIIAIETKHISGTFYPYNKNQWRWYPPNNGYTQKKILTENPQEQSVYHSKQLESSLYPIINTKIQAIVVLTNPESEYRGDFDVRCPIVSPDQLVNYVINYKTNRKFTKEDLTYIGKTLLEYDKKYSTIHYSSYL